MGAIPLPIAGMSGSSSLLSWDLSSSESDTSESSTFCVVTGSAEGDFVEVFDCNNELPMALVVADEGAVELLRG